MESIKSVGHFPFVCHLPTEHSERLHPPHSLMIMLMAFFVTHLTTGEQEQLGAELFIKQADVEGPQDQTTSSKRATEVQRKKTRCCTRMST